MRQQSQELLILMMRQNCNMENKKPVVVVSSFGKTTYIAFYCRGCHARHSVKSSGAGLGWEFNGDTIKPTITPSIMVNRARKNKLNHVCHSFVTDGKIQYLSDCTHRFAGQTVDLPEIKES